MTRRSPCPLSRQAIQLVCRSAVFCLLLVNVIQAQIADRYEAARKKMVHTAVIGSGVKHERVIQSMLTTPPHEIELFPIQVVANSCKFKNGSYSNKNLFVLDSSKANLINIMQLIKSGINENKKFTKSSLFFSNKYLRKKIGDNIVE